MSRASIPLLFVIVWLAIGIGEAKKKPPASPVDLNTASAVQLEQVPGIGPGIAKAIVKFRVKSGPFRRVEDLLVIRGVTQRKLDQLRPYVVVPHA